MSTSHHVSLLVPILWGPLGLGLWVGVAVLLGRKRGAR
jgi:hypothetical protein